MDGLSQDRLRVLLRPPPQHLTAPGANRNISEEKLLELFMNSDGRDDIVLWEHKDSTDGEWENGLVVYSFNDRHMVCLIISFSFLIILFLISYFYLLFFSFIISFSRSNPCFFKFLYMLFKSSCFIDFLPSFVHFPIP